eukprot:m.311615 g.311615  ORF g.311615 m.311615 type:complete len:380 (+) comp55364_c0_seq3:110-1249(+)
MHASCLTSTRLCCAASLPSVVCPQDPPEMFRRTFNGSLRCYSMVFLHDKDRREADCGGKVILPPSALAVLIDANLPNPWMFSVKNIRQPAHVTHCGVLEFVAEEGRAYLPSWMMRTLLLRDGDTASITSITLPPATYAKFEPQSTAFLEITDPRAVLEYSLRSFTCLTKGDVFAISYLKKPYEIRVVELKPKTAVSIFECNVQLDFEKPVGYVEPEFKKPSGASAASSIPAALGSTPPVASSPISILSTTPTSSTFVGTGFRVDGKPIKPLAATPSSLTAASPRAGSAPPPSRPASTVARAASASTAGPTTTIAAASATSPPAQPTSLAASSFVPGKLVFWRNDPKAGTPPQAAVAASSTEAESTFTAFSGTGQRLKPK